MSRYNDNLRKNIRQRRLALNLSQVELAKRCKRTDRYISALETVPRNVTLESIELLADALECSVFELLGAPKELVGGQKRVRQGLDQVILSKSALVGLDAAIRVLKMIKRRSSVT